MAVQTLDEGVLIDTLDQALAELDADFLAEFGDGPDGIDTSPDSYTGRQNPILAERDVLLQQLIVELLTLMNLDNAQGRYLDFIGTLFDEPRIPAQRATISVIAYGVPGFDIGDRRVRYIRNGTIWRAELGTLIEATGSVATTLVADVAGTNLTDGTPIEAFTDGTSQWSIIDVAGSNYTAVESTAASSQGAPVEGDPDYRIRLRVAGRSSGAGTAPGALRALQRVAGASTRIDNNRTLAVNANGVPGKSIEALVESGTDADIAQAILDGYCDSTGFFGTTSAVAFDPNSNPVTVAFTRIARIDVIWVVAIDTTGAEVPLPDDAVSIVQTALADYTNTLATGLDVQIGEGTAAARSALPDGSVPDGQITVLLALKGSAPAGANIIITSRQRARTNPEPQSGEVIAANTETYNIVSGQVLSLAADGGSAQDVTFEVTDFQFISAATALEVATAINNRTTDIVAGAQDGALTIRSETTGSASSIDILFGSTAALLIELGFVAGITFGSDSDITVTVS